MQPRLIGTHIIFVSFEQETRLQRLREREVERYGDRILPGGDMYESSQEFLAWARLYESGRLDMRTRAAHEAWLQRFDCPVLRLDSMQPVSQMVDDAVAWLGR